MSHWPYRAGGLSCPTHVQVAKLDSLHVGDRSQYKYGRRQPVRRRRGDVHGDLSAVVLHFDWAGGARLTSPCPEALAQPASVLAPSLHWLTSPVSKRALAAS